MKLLDRVAIITGANQGLGLEVARHFVREGAHIVICARNGELLDKAVSELSSLPNIKSKIFAKTIDVSDPFQVKSLVDFAINTFKKIDILVSCAGVYGTKGAIEDVDWKEWSSAIDINLKGSVLPARMVLPNMKKNKSGKIIFISGGGATKPLPGLSAYAASKAGLVRFAETLAHEVSTLGIDVNSVAPGALNTRLLDEVIEAGPKKVGAKFYQQSLKQKESGGTPLSLGADLCVYLASDASHGITGRLISAVWDPWKRMADYLDDIQNSDIYTLRRIVPDDRNKSWGG